MFIELRYCQCFIVGIIYCVMLFLVWYCDIQKILKVDVKIVYIFFSLYMCMFFGLKIENKNYQFIFLVWFYFIVFIYNYICLEKYLVFLILFYCFKRKIELIENYDIYIGQQLLVSSYMVLLLWFW